MLFIANRAIFNSWEGFKTRRYAPGVLFQTFEALSFLQNETTGFWSVLSLQMKKQVFFEAFFKFTKWRNTFLKFTTWRNTFLKRLLFLQNEETRFWSVYVLSNLQNEETRFWSLRMKKHVFQAFFKFTSEETRFWSVFQVYNMKKHVFQAF